MPHPDLADLFDNVRSSYVYQDEGLDKKLTEVFGQEYTDERDEVEFLTSKEEPRTLEEIAAAEAEFFDRVWYVRSVVRSTNESDDGL